MSTSPSNSLRTLQAEYIEGFRALDGDLDGRESAQRFMDGSTAIYHGEVVNFGFIPKLYDESALRLFRDIAETTHRILTKIIDRYLHDEQYRKLFGFPSELERLICLPTGYDCQLPIARVDIFLDEDTLDFQFCEFNADGSSAMNEDREIVNALGRTETYRLMAQHHSICPQELFEGWVDEFLAIYATYVNRVDDPTIAIIDYTGSATSNEFEVFRQRFEKRGLHCLIGDIRELSFHDGALYNTEGPGGRKIDAIYRRAVTAEIMDDLQGRMDSGPSAGVRALVEAVSNQAVCMIGGFRTQIAHSKQIFKVLHEKQTAAFLTPEEQQFIRKHIPYTVYLTNDEIDIEMVVANKDRWIIKPTDRYGSAGVFAGCDHTQSEWTNLVHAHVDKDYIVQTYCRQFATPNTRPFPYDARGKALCTTRAQAEADPTFDPRRLEDWNILTGLYLYGGKFSGTFIRAGQAGIIVGFAGGITLGSLIVDCDADTLCDLSVHTRDIE